MSEKKKRGVGPLLILLAGCFWGSMGIFVRKLGEYGFSPVQIAAIRLTLAAVGFSACFLSDELGVPGSAAGAVPIVPDFDVYYRNKATREWTPLQGVFSYRDGSVRSGTQART